MEEEISEEREKKRDFVSIMLDKANKEDSETKPNTVDDQDPKEVEELTNRIRRKIQESR